MSLHPVGIVTEIKNALCKAGIELKRPETHAWGGGALLPIKGAGKSYLLTITWSYSLDEVRCPVSRKSIALLLVSAFSWRGKSLILILSRIRNHTSNVRYGFRMGTTGPRCRHMQKHWIRRVKTKKTKPKTFI